jgi:hypothetical protein
MMSDATVGLSMTTNARFASLLTLGVLLEPPPQPTWRITDRQQSTTETIVPFFKYELRNSTQLSGIMKR